MATRTQRIVPGVRPVMVILPPVPCEAAFHPASSVGLPVVIHATLKLFGRSGSNGIHRYQVSVRDSKNELSEHM